MKSDIHALWLADLRSGKHKQIGEQLCNGKGFCCLGRLTELYREANPNAMTFNGHTYIWREADGAESEEATELPSIVIKWAGFQTQVGNLSFEVFPVRHSCLARLNDDGLTFPQIADVIEYFGPEEF